MITDLLVGLGGFTAYMLVVLLIARGIHLGDCPPPTPDPVDEDLLADQPVEVLSPVEVDRRFHALTARGGPHREWWA